MKASQNNKTFKKVSMFSFLKYSCNYMYEQGNTALRWRPISASLVSPVGDSVGVRRFFFLLLPHLSLLTAMESSPPCSDTSTSSITHSSDALTAPMRVYATLCDSLCSCMNLCGPSLSCESQSALLNMCECLCIKLSSTIHTHTRTHKGLSVWLQKCITVSFPRTWRDRCESLVAVSGIGDIM